MKLPPGVLYSRFVVIPKPAFITMRIDVAFTPRDLESRGPWHTFVIVDVLRASSSIVTAFENGCIAIHPIGEPSDAFPLANGSDILACGERCGVKIQGYDLGNSPAEFNEEAVGGKRLAMCTTNGTTAIRAARDLGRIFIGCFLNAPAVASCLRTAGQDLMIVCAGREGGFSIEDTLCAGAMISGLHGEMTDAALASIAIYDAYQGRIQKTLQDSEHGRFLQRIGFAEDVVYCSRVGTSDIVPRVYSSGQPPPHDLVIRPTVLEESLYGGSDD